MAIFHYGDYFKATYLKQLILFRNFKRKFYKNPKNRQKTSIFVDTFVSTFDKKYAFLKIFVLIFKNEN